MKTRLRVIVALSTLTVWTGAYAASPPLPANAQLEEEQSKYVFALLPKSLQRRPRVEFNVLTTLTSAGKELATPSREAPAYYQLEEGVNRHVGVGAEYYLKSPPAEKVREILQAALAESGYRPAGGDHPASLVILFHWGSSSYYSEESEDEVFKRRVLLDRAMLIGGEAFTKRVVEAFAERDRNAMSPNIAWMGPGPFEKLSQESAQMSRLVIELFSSSYYVIASAFDYASLTRNQPVLLWRTKMTVNSIGVNMTETVPPLIASAAPYFGRDMDAPLLVTKRISRDGKVEIGEATVVEADVKAASPEATAAPAAPVPTTDVTENEKK